MKCHLNHKKINWNTYLVVMMVHPVWTIEHVQIQLLLFGVEMARAWLRQLKSKTKLG